MNTQRADYLISLLLEGLTPEDAKKLSVKLDPEMEAFDRENPEQANSFKFFELHHADHGKIGGFVGKLSGGHFDVNSFGLDKEYLQKRGVKVPRDFGGSWWSSADAARDHKVARNHLGVSGVRQIVRELRSKFGVRSINSTERITGARLRSYAKRRGMPRQRTQTFTTPTYTVRESDEGPKPTEFHFGLIDRKGKNHKRSRDFSLLFQRTEGDPATHTAIARKLGFKNDHEAVGHGFVRWYEETHLYDRAAVSGSGPP